MHCTACNAENVGGKFCGECGIPLSAGATRESAKAERRHLTVLFCDLVGSTALSEELDPEDLREVVQAYQSSCSSVIGRHDGYIAQYLGDGLLVYFGYPSAHEDDARRAVRAGLEIIETVQKVHAAGRQLRVRVGIHSGVVVVGEIGEGPRREQLALGETPNFANHVQTRAEPGWVVISEATERLVRGFFRISEMGEEARLKDNPGRASRPLRLFRILATTGATTRIEAAGSAGLTPFVGRKAEVDFLSDGWSRVNTGQSRSILVRGEPGIGKSRLVEVVKDWVEPDRHDLLECRCSPYHQNTVLHPVVEMLKRRFGFTRAEPTAEEGKNLEERIIALGLPTEEALPLFAPLFSIPLGDRKLEMTPAKQRQRTLELLADALMRLAARHPTLLLIEDLQWADPTTLELIKVVLSVQKAATPPASLMVLLTARPDFVSSTVACTVEMNLQPLPREDSKLLVAHLTGKKALPDEVLGQLLMRAGGVPLFVEEVTKAVLEGGAFRELDDRYELARPLPVSVVPDSLRDSLRARFDRLRESMPTAQLAATLGREFRYDVLKSVSSLDDATLERDLSRLVDAELVYRKGTPPQQSYTFKHALIQDAAYDSLLRKVRQEYHGQIARTLAERFPHLKESEPELLARHYEGAGMSAEAISYWRKAGERAMARAANLEAIAHLRHAVELVCAQPAAPEALNQELAIQLALGPALMAIRGYAALEVREAYTRAREICRALGDGPQLYPILWGLWAYYFVGGNLGQALDLGEQVHRLANGSDTSLLAASSHALGYPTLYRADYRKAFEIAEAALKVFNMQNEVEMVRQFQFSSTTALYDIAGTALWALGYPDRALAYAEKANTLAADLKHPPSIAYAASAFSWGVPHLRGEAAKVREAAETAVRLSSAEEFSFWPPLTRVFLGWSYIADGDVEAGIAETQDALKRYRNIGGGILRTTAGAILADGYRRLSRFDEALATIEEALATAETSGERHYEQELHRIKGEVLSDLGRLPEAEAAICHALDLTRTQGAKSLELRAAMSLSRLWLKTGKRDAARDLLAKIDAWFTEGQETRDRREARALLAELGSA